MMNEMEKAAAGLMYDANYAPELLELRLVAKSILHEFNHTHPRDLQLRKMLLQKLLGSISDNITIEPPFHCDYGFNISVGENFYANVNLTILDGAKVTIGDNVFIAPNVGLHTAGHPLDAERRNQGLEYALPITIGDNVWLGANVIVLPGVTIGNNSVIGAGSVITRDIPAGVLAFGNPCRVIRPINEEDGRRIGK